MPKIYFSLKQVDKDKVIGQENGRITSFGKATN
jgi:hypothetical protein